MLNEQTIYCPLVKREISCVECMETEYRKNADIIEELGGLEEFEKNIERYVISISKKWVHDHKEM